MRKGGKYINIIYIQKNYKNFLWKQEFGIEIDIIINA